MSRPTFPSLRIGFTLGLLACAGVLAYALYVQFQLHIEPCPLCIVQRIVFIVMGLIFLIGALHAPRGGGRWVYVVLIGLVGLAGVGTAWRHLWLQSLPPDLVPSCGPGLGYMLDAFPLSQTIKMVFTGSGECAVVNWSFLGLAMPAWSLICFVVFSLWAVYVALAPRRPYARMASA